ncbi:uncharacterized protein A4U43_C02F1690 [Asparagus officinalis]|uniref:Putative zinc-finger domain-containing protein n=1 Tax=Asparagus officinalis TaxID=4686 RepID=A0A5P1FJW5_ASPOF|nr:uncharacterized protein A4U43_C02F1690 [Asparagus officinalis]
MSTKSAGEEIEELRAKAIASMPTSSANPSSGPRSKSSQSKEEGEISPSEDAASELPTCSGALPNATILEEQAPMVSVDDHDLAKSDFSTLKTLRSSSPSMVNAQVQTAAAKNYSKHFKTAQVPHKATNNRNLSWHGKGSDENLVISFSDDDSESNSEESESEKTISRKENIARANRSEVPIASTPLPSRKLQGSNRTNLVQKKGLVNPARISDMRTRLTSSNYVGTPAEMDSLAPRHKLSTKTSARQEQGYGPDSYAAYHRLANLRQEIVLRENKLKAQNKSIPQSNEKTGGPHSGTGNRGPHAVVLATKATGVKRPASVADKGLIPKEKVQKHLKPSVGTIGKHSSINQLKLPISAVKSAHGCSSQLMENDGHLHKRDIMESRNHKNENQQHAAVTSTMMSSGGLLKVNNGPTVPVSETMCSNALVFSKNRNQSKLVSDVSRSYDNSEKREIAINFHGIPGQRPCLSQIDPNIEDGALRESNVLLHRDPNRELPGSNITRCTDVSTMLPNKVPGDHNIMGTRQTLASTAAQRPLETSSHFSQRCAGQASDGKSGNTEASLQNPSILNYSTQINTPGEASMNLQSLMELEDLQDKELEEAQELRRRCELEERRALKAYRKAQRALFDANEKCCLLYRKRELFSAQLRGLLMQASDSILPSGWQSHGGTVSESIETLPDARFGLLCSLGHHLAVEGRSVGQFGSDSNTRCSSDARADASCQKLNEHDLVSAQCEQDASALDHRDNHALDGALSPAFQSNASNEDDENYAFEQRPLRFQVLSEVNHVQTTSGMTEAIRLPSDEIAQDYGLLEASLRSKLVKRFGSRFPYKNNKIGEAECLVQEGTDKSEDATNFTFSDQQMQEGEKTEILYLEGVERLGGSTNQLAADSQSHNNSFSLVDEGRMDRDFQEDSFLDTESCRPNQTTGSILPSSVLHVASRHAKSMLLVCLSDLSSTGEKETVLREKITECMPDEKSTSLHGMVFSRIGKLELHNYDLTIDPFWPFCMFELRGKCNNEECLWQHIKHHTHRNLKNNGQASLLPSVANSDNRPGPPHYLFPCILPIPSYHIGSVPIKVDSHLSQSVLARSIWQYWQRGFCASFSLPFSVQRVLPPDVPFLQTCDGPVADGYSWNRLALYYQTLDGSMQSVHELPESEQSLEMALDLFDGSVCKPDRKKALCLLSRAIEVNPTSVVLWVVYLHIYYAKEKNIGKDDMFFHAVQNNDGSYELWLMYINSRRQLGDRLNAYEHALMKFCRTENVLEKERRYISACILDIFLQMIDFVCMSGQVEMAVQKIFGLLGNSGDTLLSDIHSSLIVSDRCIFWFCCLYLVIYRKLPELIVQQLEFEKELPFNIEWPSTHLTTDTKHHVLNLMKLAVDKMALDTDANPHRKDQIALRSLHFLAVSHIKCVVALEGLHCSAELLASYLSLYPNSIELILISARLKENYTGDLVFKGFEELLSNWPSETSGTQCLWNQYIQHALVNKRTDLAEILLDRWFQCFSEDINLHEGKDGSCDCSDLPSHVKSDGGLNSSKQYDVFWFLNLSLYRIMKKNLMEAHCAIDKALKLASPQDYKHCVREHALCY